MCETWKGLIQKLGAQNNVNIYHLDGQVMTNKCKSQPNRNNLRNSYDFTNAPFQDKHTHSHILTRAPYQIQWWNTSQYSNEIHWLWPNVRYTYLYDFFICNIGLVHLFFDHFAVAVRIQCGYVEKWLKSVKLSLFCVLYCRSIQ